MIAGYIMSQSNYGGETSKESILRCAIELGQEIGVEDTSIRRICKKANLSIGAFYHYYKSKEELVNEAFLQFDTTLNDVKLERYAQMPPVDAIRAVLMDHLHNSVSLGYPLMTEFYRSLLQFEFRHAVNPQRAYYQAVTVNVARAQEQEIYTKEMKDVEIAEFFIRYSRGNTIDWCLHNGKYDVVAITEKQLDSILYADFLLTDKARNERAGK